MEAFGLLVSIGLSAIAYLRTGRHKEGISAQILKGHAALRDVEVLLKLVWVGADLFKVRGLDQDKLKRRLGSLSKDVLEICSFYAKCKQLFPLR
jgi:hypothetical protein